ncbi:MAG: UDP-N-acetylmuramoyl-L-alanine--D-glutamate ligase [Candidatus Pacebacteria bacterium]|nr:UDP-N-acetylmuramoyl-L-alanine--D-glutamate ligase [Candidatus Paceibacterota bacterium]
MLDFRNKKVVVMRIGLLGRGVGDTAWLAEQGAEVLVVDDASQEVMQPSVDALAEFDNVKFKFGEYDFADFKDADFVLVGAGAPIDLPVLMECREAGVVLKQSAVWFAELSGIPVVGVTGTRGKSTVTHMIHHVVSELTGESVLLGGNIRGVSNLQLLNDVKEDSIVIMELDSWQLQGWGWAKISPQIAVFTNFMSDHMNYYHNDMSAYFADKANIFRYQEESGVFITVPEVFEQAKQVSGVTIGQEVVLVDGSALPEDMLLSMPGEHNRLNAAIAYEALKAISLTDEEIFSGLASFPGVPGRLEYLGQKGGIKIYNDNNSTTPEATVKGLLAVGNKDSKNIILVAGGAYKEVDPKVLVEAIPKYCKKVLLLPGTGTDLIKSEIECEVVENVSTAVKAAMADGESGDVLLFSPGFASFGEFKNEYERNDEFVKCINEVSEEE